MRNNADDDPGIADVDIQKGIRGARSWHRGETMQMSQRQEGGPKKRLKYPL